MKSSPLRFGIALGSNLGDRLDNLRCGVHEVLKRSGATLVAAAPVYETEPVDCPAGSQAFLNTVIELECGLEPHALHIVLQAVEKLLGRPDHRERNAPRPLDLDILYAGELVIADKVLTVPHPRLHERSFVLRPLVDIRPHLVLPGRTTTTTQLLQCLPDSKEIKLFCDASWIKLP